MEFGAWIFTNMSIDLNNISSFQGAIVTVMGLGRFKNGSGIGTAKWLIRHGAQIVITDLKNEDELRVSVDEITSWYEKYKEEYPERDIYSPIFVLGEHREDDFVETDLVIQNPGVLRESEFVQLAKEHGVLVESDMSLFFRFCPSPLYVVTGTRGKSTTAALLGEMFKKINSKTVVAGNAQRSPLEDLDLLLNEKEVVPVVLEMSSWLIDSLENVIRPPNVAIFTNIFSDHLNRYPSPEVYRDSKAAIFYKQNNEQIGIFNFDQEEVRRVGEKTLSKKIWFSKKPLPDGLDGAYVVDSVLIWRVGGAEKPVLPVSEIKLQGEHNIANALAVICAAKIAGLPDEVINNSLKEFGGLPGRQEVIRELNGVSFVNDTTATSPDGVIAALDRFGQKEKVILLAGGATKGLSFDQLGKVIRATCKLIIWLEGTATDELIVATGDSIPSVRVDSIKAAVEAAAAAAQAGDVVLLSPGTAAPEIFKNEFVRGEQFVEAVNKLK